MSDGDRDKSARRHLESVAFREIARVHSAEDKTIELRLRYGPDAPAVARLSLEQLNGLLLPETMYDLRLLVSEIVTNAVKHSSPPGGRTIRLYVAVTSTGVRVEVTDAGQGFDPSEVSHAPDYEGGWGLGIVAALSDKWGITEKGGTCVWFEMSRGKAAEGTTSMAGLSA